MDLLVDDAWHGRIHIDGQWVQPGAGDYAVVEPATGDELAQMGRASAQDVARAAEGAARAQPEWAAMPHPARAAVLRKAGDLWQQHADEISHWNIREVGAVPGMAVSQSTSPPRSATRRPPYRRTPPARSW